MSLPTIEQPLFLPVLLGTARQGRMSEPVARFLVAELEQRSDVTTELIDVARLTLPMHDAGRAAQDPQFAATLDRSDGLVIVVPEYNHGYPGLLKHALDSNLAEYMHKAVGLVGVSAGSFAGARGVQNLLPVLRRLGLVSIVWDLNVGNVGQVFDASGELQDEAYRTRAGKFLDELEWMATTLRYGRRFVAVGEGSG